MRNFSISVVIPTLGTSVHLPKLIESLKAQRLDSNFEILIIDNSLNDQVQDALKRYQSNVYASQDLNFEIKVLQTTTKGVNTARNVGIAASRGEIILFVDDDCWLNDVYLLQKHVHYQLKNPDVFALGGYYTLDVTAGFLDRCYQEIQMQWLQMGVVDHRTGRTRYLIGGHFSVKKDALNLNHLRFDPNIVWGGSELSLFMQAFALGLVIQLENLSLVHNPKLSFGVLFRKLLKQGRGKAYLNEPHYEQPNTVPNPVRHTLAEAIMIKLLSTIFWYGYFLQKKQPFGIFHHLFVSFKNNVLKKKYELVDKIDSQIQEKIDRGDRL